MADDPVRDPMPTPVAAPDRRLLEQGGKMRPTPFHSAAPTLMMLEPSSATMQVCVRVAVGLRVRPLSATAATLAQAASTTRPLAIVVEASQTLDDERLADVAFAVGAIVVRVASGESPETMEQRVRSAVEASAKLRGESD